MWNQFDIFIFTFSTINVVLRHFYQTFWVNDYFYFSSKLDIVE